jgi:hypothetical protein
MKKPTENTTPTPANALKEDEAVVAHPGIDVLKVLGLVDQYHNAVDGGDAEGKVKRIVEKIRLGMILPEGTPESEIIHRTDDRWESW